MLTLRSAKQKTRCAHMIKAFIGVVHPSLCDAMGHLNSRHYVAMFDDATYVVIAHLGYRPGTAHGWADVRNEVDYVSEVRAGAVVEIFSGIAKIGTKSLTLVSEMRPFEGTLIYARMRAVLVSFDLVQRCAMPISEEIRERASALSTLDAS
jgi:acyl-CoA thioester hydrolase